MNAPQSSWTPRLRIRLGLASCAMGLLMLVYGIEPRFDGRVTYGEDRDGPVTTLAREANPRRFDQITYSTTAFGALMTVGGLALAWTAARSRERR